MHYLPRVALAASILCLITSQSSIKTAEISQSQLIKRVENALNQKDISNIFAIENKQLKLDLATKYDSFLEKFPNAKWQVLEREALKDGRTSLEISIRGGNKENSKGEYSIEAKQLLALEFRGSKITNYEIISEQTIFQKSKIPVSITLNIPSIVLTGTSYDFDIILDKPLGNQIIAGGITDLSTDQIKRQVPPNIELAPLGGGGLFKTIKAPLKPGIQNWAAVITHSEGIISITKMVRVVSNESEIEL